MPNWNDVLGEINGHIAQFGPAAMDVVRRKYLAELHSYTGRNIIAYYSSFLSKPRDAGIEVNDNDKNGLMLCVHELDKTKGLDLILHTPGGSIAATESIVHYLYEMFGHDIRAVVPQIAMSAGTMIACACKSVLMGKHSNLGPCDPQIDGFPAVAVKRQWEQAYTEIVDDPRTADAWRPILSQLGPSFLKECDWAIEETEAFVARCLAENMLAGKANAVIKATEITKRLTAEDNRGHGKHFHYQDCIGMGLNVAMIEEDDKLQDLVLTVHHCYMHSCSNTLALKIIENHLGRAQINNSQSMPIFQFGGPPAFGTLPGNS